MDITNLSQLLSLKQVDELTYQNIASRKNPNNALFGGQVLSQALVAALQTVEDRPAHSLHAYFLRAGSADVPVDYNVELSRDGGSMSARRVNAIQYEKSILNLAASFHKPEQGFEHQREPMGHIPRPEDLDTTFPPEHITKDKDSITSEDERRYGYQFGIEFRDIGEINMRSTEVTKPEHSYWLRATETLSDDPVCQQGALAYISDMRLIGASLLPHPSSLYTSEVLVASIDHALWFHSTDFNVNEWMLFQLYSPWAGSGRGFARAHVYNDRGTLIASISQEGIIRKRKT